MDRQFGAERPHIWASRPAPDAHVLLAGDFDSVSPHDPEPEGFDVLSAHHRIRYLPDDLLTADRSVLAQLEAVGRVDVGHRMEGTHVPAVPTAGFTGTEFAGMRCDYVGNPSPRQTRHVL